MSETGLVTCGGCGAQYVRGISALCAECGTPLVGLLLPAGGDEVGYELDDWREEEREELTMMLSNEGIALRWEETELVVDEAAAARVEALIDQLEAEDDDGDDDDEPLGAEVLSALYVSADVLQHEPANEAAVAELLVAVETMPERPPYGIDRDLWTAVGERADAVADLLADGATGDDVSAAAHALRESVRPLV
jgi:hypothetical protein